MSGVGEYLSKFHLDRAVLAQPLAALEIYAQNATLAASQPCVLKPPAFPHILVSLPDMANHLPDGFLHPGTHLD